MPGLRVFGRGGIRVKAGGERLWLDSYGEGTVLISHAHSDHIPRRKARVIATPQTLSILKAFGRRMGGRSLGFGETLKVGGFTVSAQPSGHVLGSSQFIIEVGGERLVYTGDLNIYDSILLEGGRPIEAEKLIIESTYGLPGYRFPPREEVYSSMVRWILSTIREGEIPAFKVYALGKAQEVIKMVNTFLGIPVVAGWTVSRVSDKHVEHGLGLDYLPLHKSEGLEAFSQGECVYVASRRENPPSKRRLRWAVATGWALRYRYPRYDASFPLSGHSDFPGLVEYIEHSNPREVFTVHGYSGEFARILRRMGWRARPLDEASQSLLI